MIYHWVITRSTSIVHTVASNWFLCFTVKFNDQHSNVIYAANDKRRMFVPIFMYAICTRLSTNYIVLHIPNQVYFLQIQYLRAIAIL